MMPGAAANCMRYYDYSYKHQRYLKDTLAAADLQYRQDLRRSRYVYNKRLADTGLLWPSSRGLC